jgi:hypothetical protein
MKKLITLATLALLFYVGNAQTSDNIFKPFRVDINIGDAIPSGPGSSQGASFGIEPKYSINDQMQIGLRIEAALMVRGIIDANAASGNVTGIGSYTATGDYYFTTNKFRPFAGIGLGICRTASIAFEVKDPNQGDLQMAIGSETKFESLIRAGFEYGHGRFALEYNIIPKSTFNGDQNTTITVKNSYFGIKLGVAIGGGRYKK